ncbi:hypothetical protein BDE36_3465 [Arcticibacter tournemirensis]|uniref:Uncharacterized protein n=1 Tax=Arcticibacter tournemirensis TaxID=699437 RepID=A0A5M9H667_9SPHI|nr:hypothetical protein [Arcticibacter tournemirensis]KAA8482432.1 hypothetical protein F1649_12030 [Arcticibacter tournemirensis]TQM51682.1 hypothetical protein BDE36_3465 [Arcticibacter tournemirensis]
MKTVTQYLTLIISMLALSSCKKDGEIQDTRNVLAVSFSILNVGSTPLEAMVDTFRIEIPTGRFDLTRAFPLPAAQRNMKLSITEKATGKPVMEKELKKEDGRADISFFYMNGEIGNVPQVPPVEDGKIKIIYMFRPVKTNYAEPVDIVLGKYYLTPKVFEEITRIKNVKANEFTDPVTISTFTTSGQQYNGQPSAVSFQVYIYKAGTNEFYTQGTGYSWNPTGSTAPKPSSATASSKLYIFSESPGNYMAFTKNFEI